MSSFTVNDATHRLEQATTRREDKAASSYAEVRSYVEGVRRVQRNATLEELRDLQAALAHVVLAGRSSDPTHPRNTHEVAKWNFEDGALFALDLMVSEQVDRANAEADRLHGLPRGQAVRLEVVAALRDNVEFSAAAFLRTDAAARNSIRPDEVSRVLSDLRGRGWVEQVSSTGDNRVKVLTLTASGREDAQ